MTTPKGQTLSRHPLLEPLRFPGGGSGLPTRLMPGPMEGVTTGSFCTVLTRLGYVRSWIAPFIRISTGLPRRSRLRRKLAPFMETGLPVIAQIMGTDADMLAGTAQRLATLGVAAVDLNCGCPSQMVVRSGAGGERLRDPAWIHDTLVKMRQAMSGCGVTVKLRSGFEHPEELSDILQAVQQAAPDAVILHYRTVAEQYRPVKDGWSRLAQARDLLPDTVLIGSGDLFTVGDILRMREQTGVDGVAPARGLLRNPRLLLDAEEACRGRTTELPTPIHRWRVLREIVHVSEHDPDAPPGFALELAGHMFGKRSMVFRELTRCGTLGAVASCIDSTIRELEHDNDDQSGT